MIRDLPTSAEFAGAAAKYCARAHGFRSELGASGKTSSLRVVARDGEGETRSENRVLGC